MAQCQINLWQSLDGYKGNAKIDHIWTHFEEVEIDPTKLDADQLSTLAAELNAMGVEIYSGEQTGE